MPEEAFARLYAAYARPVRAWLIVRAGAAADDLFGRVDDAEIAREVELPRTIGDPPAPWRRTIGAMILTSCWHARLHLTRLEQLLAQS